MDADSPAASSSSSPGAASTTKGQDIDPDTQSVSPHGDRAQVVGAWLTMASRWSVKLVIVVATLVLVLWGMSLMWAGLMPVILSLILTALLSPVASWLTHRGVPRTLSAAITLLGALVVIIGSLVFVAPSVARQVAGVPEAASKGFDQLQKWVSRSSLQISDGQINDAADQAATWVQERGGDIASGAFSGASALGGVLINTVLILALTFLFLKDGHKFGAWTRSVLGQGPAAHSTELLARNWTVLGGFIRTQALVSAIDAVLIGLGLWALGVPLALALTVITFFAGFIPIVGALTAGGLAVLVALFFNGWQVALLVLGLIFAVQQLEGNVLSPALQGKTMSVHPALILVTVTIGGTLFGILGVFLAVPFTAMVVATARYASEQVDLRTGDAAPEDLAISTDEGMVAARRGQAAAGAYRTSDQRDGPESG